SRATGLPPPRYVRSGPTSRAARLRGRRSYDEQPDPYARLAALLEAEVAAAAALREGLGALEAPAERLTARHVGEADVRREVGRAVGHRHVADRAALVVDAVVEAALPLDEAKHPASDRRALRAPRHPPR